MTVIGKAQTKPEADGSSLKTITNVKDTSPPVKIKKDVHKKNSELIDKMFDELKDI